MNHHLDTDHQGDILIVDDTPDNLRLLSAMLTMQGFEVRKALNGRRAIASAQADLPDLILLDIKMPEMNGYEVCQKLKADPKTKEVPVIFISALDEALDKVKAFAAGGTDYITKPFQETEVLARIENQLRIRRLQRQLLKQNEELARSNRELEQFAYVVSHDLQQPLQSITGFAKLIILKDNENLDPSTQEYLNCIMDAGGRMQRLIQDLLTYAQVGQQTQPLEPVDCNQVLEEALTNLRSAIAEKNATVTSDALPIVLGYEVQLIQVLQNLISNAIKFTRSDVSPQIHISAIVQDQQCQFTIRDNGIGMTADNLNRIFEVFQRVHSCKQYAGNGIGLATCKKIIENHGGQIWAESQVDCGTTFHFTLKEAPVITEASL